MEARRAKGFTVVFCSKCKNEIVQLFYKIRIPKRRRKLWIEFRDWLENTYPFYKGKLKLK